jgi:hypothetical protein
LSNPIGQLCYKLYGDTEAEFGARSSKNERFPKNPGNAVNRGIVETKPKAWLLLGVPVHCAGVLCVSLGSAVQAITLQPTAGHLSSCSHGEAAFKE